MMGKIRLLITPSPLLMNISTLELSQESSVTLRFLASNELVSLALQASPL